jgi:hypothetical protein
VSTTGQAQAGQVACTQIAGAASNGITLCLTAVEILVINPVIQAAVAGACALGGAVGIAALAVCTLEENVPEPISVDPPIARSWTAPGTAHCIVKTPQNTYQPCGLEWERTDCTYTYCDLQILATRFAPYDVHVTDAPLSLLWYRTQPPCSPYACWRSWTTHNFGLAYRETQTLVTGERIQSDHLYVHAVGGPDCFVDGAAWVQWMFSVSYSDGSWIWSDYSVHAGGQYTPAEQFLFKQSRYCDYH